ncbi:MAG: hypothetical protein V4773_02460, partial [Verrucomicrobiota bacterium]
SLWISGSRATGKDDRHSDTDIRLHGPRWTEQDTAELLARIGPEGGALVRLSKLAPTVWNYECVFANDVAVDLLINTGETAQASADSVVFKAGEALKRQPALQLVRETVPTPAEVRNLMDGLAIDLGKFPKLFARGERLAALFLLDVQRYAVLRLAYLATRGADCGIKTQHTLASLKVILATVLGESSPEIRTIAKGLEIDEPVEKAVDRMTVAMPTLFAVLRKHFPGT